MRPQKGDSVNISQAVSFSSIGIGTKFMLCSHNEDLKTYIKTGPNKAREVSGHNPPELSFQPDEPVVVVN